MKPATPPPTQAERPATTMGEGRLHLGDILFDRYQIVQTFAGGMGMVYKVLDMDRGWFLAVKTLPELRADAVQQFLNEMERMIEFPPHSHVVQVEAVRFAGPQPYLFMEFVEGSTLHDTLRLAEGHRLPLRTAARFGLQLCRGLHFIHDKGHVLHLDVKPANILIDRQGVLKIADLGISQPSFVLARSLAAASSFGTPLYMSPEHLRGDPVDIWSDIYSFGIVFYEMLMGASPYPFDVASATADGSLRERLLEFHRDGYDFHDALSHRTILPGLSSELGTILGHCLARLPSKRVPDLTYLERWLEREFKGIIPPDAVPLRAVDYHRKAVNLQALGKHSKALECFNNAMSADPGDGRLWEDVARSYAALGMRKEEEMAHQRAARSAEDK